ncbi:con-10 family general stress protein [Hymenobacter puniceus]|uniref:KGG domain-containing protein n=1 Tax=Hymenobacter sp. BT190 TaxID=2763505 RepID=UPI001650E86A|nr:KGG domain-containing protein [Hymenobacter sp. BT190]MBC6698543.1 hypothetical protein [Hymenobacter sp. BT190]
MATSRSSAIKPADSAAPTNTISRRGFASMDPELQKRIAREGGKASHASGRGHRFTPEEARIAGRKGGQVRRPAL